MQNPPLTLIAFIGLPGSGKSVAASILEKQGFEVIRLGDLTDIKLKEKGLERTSEHEQLIREEIRLHEGMDAYAKWCEIEILKRENSKKIVLEGVRSWEECEYLKGKFPHLLFVGIYSPPSTRYQRLKERKERPLTELEARRRDVFEIDNLHMGPTLALPDQLIVNTGNMAEFEQSILGLLS